jgi:hypothetical protein
MVDLDEESVVKARVRGEKGETRKAGLYGRS